MRTWNLLRRLWWPLVIVGVLTAVVWSWLGFTQRIGRWARDGTPPLMWFAPPAATGDGRPAGGGGEGDGADDPVASRLGQSGTFGDSFGVLNTLFTGLAFGGVVIALLLEVQSRREDKAEQRLRRTVELFQDFRSEKLRESRTRAWAARKRWFADPGYRRRLVEHLYVADHDDNPDLEDDVNATFDLLEYFTILAHEAVDRRGLLQFHGRYAYYRGYLSEFADAMDERYRRLVSQDGHATEEQRKSAERQFPHPPFRKALARLDRRLRLSAYSRGDHPIDREIGERIADTAPEVLPSNEEAETRTLDQNNESK